MGLFSRNTSSDSKPEVTDELAREIGSLVNDGKLRQANKLTKNTSDPQATAFAAFRYIDVE